jgi:hypothetical protein
MREAWQDVKKIAGRKGAGIKKSNAKHQAKLE